MTPVSLSSFCAVIACFQTHESQPIVAASLWVLPTKNHCSLSLCLSHYPVTALYLFNCTHPDLGKKAKDASSLPLCVIDSMHDLNPRFWSVFELGSTRACFSGSSRFGFVT